MKHLMSRRKCLSLGLFAFLAISTISPVLVGRTLSAQESPEPSPTGKEASDKQDPRAAQKEIAKTDVPPQAAKKKKQQKTDEGLISLIVRGGWTMLGLGLISTIILAFSIERYLYFRRKGVATKGFSDQLASLLQSGDLGAVREELQRKKGLLSEIVAYGIDHQSLGVDGMERALERRATVEIGKLERGLNLLANFGNLAPLLGFFGTVVGMRASFLQFVIQKAPTAQDLAGGVEEALITTAAGLLVAIPTYLIYNLFIYQIDSLTTEVEVAAAQIRDTLTMDATPQSRKKTGGTARSKTTKATRKKKSASSAAPQKP